MDEIQNTLDALKDSVFEINRIISSNLNDEQNLRFLKANIDHLSLKIADNEVDKALTGQDNINVINAITNGTSYYQANS